MAKTLPISKRLLCCAALVPEGSRLADIGTDHGYLGIHLLREGRVRHVVAADLRPQPLARARENAREYGTDGQMEFLLSDGLEKLDPMSVDAVVCAGMGGDLIIRLLENAPWLRDARYTLILQPQSAGQAVRRYLADPGFAVADERLVEDAGFLYTVLRACFDGVQRTLTAGEQYVSRQLLENGGALLPAYLRRVEKALAITVAGLRSADTPRPERQAYYEQALADVQEMERQYGNSQ